MLVRDWLSVDPNSFSNAVEAWRCEKACLEAARSQDSLRESTSCSFSFCPGDMEERNRFQLLVEFTTKNGLKNVSEYEKITCPSFVVMYLGMIQNCLLISEIKLFYHFHDSQEVQEYKRSDPF